MTLFYWVYVETRGKCAQRGWAIPVGAGRGAVYHQIWDAGGTPAWSAPRICVEPFYSDWRLPE